MLRNCFVPIDSEWCTTHTHTHTYTSELRCSTLIVERCNDKSSCSKNDSERSSNHGLANSKHHLRQSSNGVWKDQRGEGGLFEKIHNGIEVQTKQLIAVVDNHLKCVNILLTTDRNISHMYKN